MRDTNVNPVSDESILRVMNSYEQSPYRWDHCENCGLYTRKEVVAFDYYDNKQS